MGGSDENTATVMSEWEVLMKTTTATAIATELKGSR